jgi:hypothetical protein
MKKKILTLCGVLIFILLGINSVWAVGDPGNRDTLWIGQASMDSVKFGIYGRQFAVKCSIYTDEYVQGFKTPLIFFHNRNKDVYVDSVKYESWVLAATPSITGFVKHNGPSNDPLSTLGDTAKTLQFGLVWFSDSIPPTHPTSKPFCKIWFHTGTGVPLITNFDTSRSVVLDTCTYEGQYELEMVDVTATSFMPVFVPGAIGSKRTLSGKVSGATLPAAVTVSGDRKKRGSTNGSGNYSFVVGKGGNWVVFRDSTAARYTLTNLQNDTVGLNFVGTSDVREVVSGEKVLPEAFSLNQNYPNPFNPNTVIRFSLPQDCWVKLEVYNLLGQKVKTLVDQMLKTGTREVVWDGKNQAGAEVSSGIYFYRIKAKDFTDIKKMVLVK